MKRVKKRRGKRNKRKFIASISDNKTVVTITPNAKTAKALKYFTIDDIHNDK